MVLEEDDSFISEVLEFFVTSVRANFQNVAPFGPRFCAASKSNELLPFLG